MSDIASLAVDNPWLMLGDCVERMREIPDEFVDLTVTSPPYDKLRKYEGYSFDFEGIARELYRVTNPGGVVVWVVGDETVKGSETGTSFRQALFFMDVCGFRLHDTMIWNKGGFTAVGSLRARYGSVFEYMFVLSRGKPKTFNPLKDRHNKTFGRKLNGTIRKRDGSTKPKSNQGFVTPQFGQRFNIWEISAEARRGLHNHPAVFPEQLAADHIFSWSNPGDTVFDPFLGSGTAGKMAVLAGRKFIGCETSELYLDNIARPRIAAAIAAISRPAPFGGLFDAQAAD